MPFSFILSQPADGPGSFDFTRLSYLPPTVESFPSGSGLHLRKRLYYRPILTAGFANPIPMCRMGFGRTWTDFPQLRLWRCFLW
jgi:hypothetical protein